jgi:transposase InsO family protein
MPTRRYERREPTHDWQQLRPLLKDPAQFHYEVIRPVVLFGQTPKERAAETGVPRSTIYYRANLFDQAGMASLFPAAPPPPVSKQNQRDQRMLPPNVRQAMVDVHAEYPALSLREMASICYARFNHRPSPRTIKMVLAAGPKPQVTARRYPPYAEIPDPVQRRKAILKLHFEGWNKKSIAGYLQVSRPTVHAVLKRFAEEHFAGLPDRSSAPRSPNRKVTLQAVQEVKKLAENPELGAFRVSAALEQMGIKLSPATCGRVLSLNRDLYHLKAPRKGGRPKAKMPYRAERRHQLWSVDIRYLDMHRLENVEMVYCISILENFSRACLASAISLRQDTEAFFAVFYKAVRTYGVPEVLVSDNGSIFTSQATRTLCAQLGIEKKEIKKGKPYQNYIETFFNVQRRMADWSFEKAQTYEDLLAAHEKWHRDYNFQKHLAHEKRDDGCHSPAAVLGWVKGMQPEPDLVSRAFEAICETRTLTKAGYARFRNFLLYGEQGLAGKRALINIFQEVLTLEYGDYPLSRYSVEWQPDDHHLLRVGNPRLYDHPYQSPQLSLWEPGDVEWFVIIRTAPPSRRRRKKGRLLVIQPPLWASGTQG